MQAHFPTQHDWTDRQRSEHIRRHIQASCIRMRDRHPWLRHQDAIGATILILSLSGMFITGALYLHGHLPWWACVILNAIFCSFMHELEHDLIHRLYFRRRKLPHNLMLALVWLARPSTINPWLRRPHHLAHHRLSGTRADLEERTLSNGHPWGVIRLIMTADLMIAASVLVAEAESWREKRHILKTGISTYVPLTILHWATWYLFLGLHLFHAVSAWIGHPIDASGSLQTMVGAVDAIVVIVVAPNILRTFSLHFISSNLHYYGDIEQGNLMQQTQVMTSPWLWPLQLFCVNFGGTHAIHHFVVNEPFYIRQMSARAAHQVMRSMGVRFNDFGTFRRANRFTTRRRDQPLS